MPEKPSAPTPSTYKLNLRFLWRTIRLARPYWVSNEKRKAGFLLALLVILLLGYTWFAVLFNQQSGEFTSALAARDGSRFWHSIGLYFLLLVIGVPTDAYYYYVLDILALNWRRWLTDRFLGRYLRDHRYYHLLSRPEIDNPDQRIADDIYSFTRQSLSFVLTFANAFFQVIAFGGVLWSISHQLVVFLFVYAAAVTVTTFRIFGEKMVSLHFIQRGREADFRFGLVRLRENAEAIALYRGEGQENQRLRKVFGRLFDNAMRIIRWSLGLNLFYYGNSYLTIVLPTLIIAPRVLSGQLEVGRIVQAAGAFSAILGALSILVDNLEEMSRFAASVGRLETFAHSLVSEPASKNGPAGNGKPARRKFEVRESQELAFENFTLRTPNDAQTLVRDLSISVPTGKGLLIVGPSGAGKSSLLRAIAGLWDSGEGVLARPSPQDMLFLPQHPYVVIGTLRVQLNYPNLNRTVTDEELRAVLEAVNLGSLPDRCRGFDVDYDFEKILSAGERQRLAFARVFLNHPRYVLLDEATSALDGDNESALYNQLKATSCTLISVSHRPALVKYHAQILELKENGAWELHPAGDFPSIEQVA